MLTRRVFSVQQSSTSSSLLFVARRFHTALQSEKPQPHWSTKVLRKEAPKKFFAHPMYVMAREKLLSKMWREHALFGANVYYAIGFFGVAAALRA